MCRRRQLRQRISRCSTGTRPALTHSTRHTVKLCANCYPARCASSAVCLYQLTPKLGATVKGWSNSIDDGGIARPSRKGASGKQPSGNRAPVAPERRLMGTSFENDARIATAQEEKFSA